MQFTLPRRSLRRDVRKRLPLDEKRTRKASQLIDGMALGTAVRMINPVALIMTAHEAGGDQFRNRAREIALAGRPDALVQLDVYALFGLELVLGKLAFLCEVITNALCQCNAACVALAYRGQGITEPIAKQDISFIAAHEGACAAIVSSNFGDKGKQHECISWARTDLGYSLEQLGQIGANSVPAMRRALKHHENK